MRDFLIFYNQVVPYMEKESKKQGKPNLAYFLMKKGSSAIMKLLSVLWIKEENRNSCIKFNNA